VALGKLKGGIGQQYNMHWLRLPCNLESQ